ncbi:MAG: hypothetical protein VXZ72_04225 [Chlamydiota bacterium]|nr:hypothetical protein [Chlamydiota bacterium]
MEGSSCEHLAFLIDTISTHPALQAPLTKYRHFHRPKRRRVLYPSLLFYFIVTLHNSHYFACEGTPLIGSLTPWEFLNQWVSRLNHLLKGAESHIEEGANISPRANLFPPYYFSAGCRVSAGATIRGGVYLGPGAVVGHCSEVKASLLLEGARAPHFNYVGDSLLGRYVNLGAGVICSNLRLDGKEIIVKLQGKQYATGRRKLGAIIGDRCQLGCHLTLNPGTLLTPGETRLPPPPFS